MLAYLDCLAGISGDMTLGALIDLGVPPEWLQEQLTEGLDLTGFSLEVQPVMRHHLAACQVQVRVRDEAASRDFREITRLIQAGSLPERVKHRSLQIFKRLAAAEARIHRCEPEAVHFHEVGGLDALVDIVGTVLALDYLNVNEVVCSRIPVGRGITDSRHGRIPVPAPATLAVLQNVDIYGTEISFELTTPTGAAIAAGLARNFGPLPEMKIQAVGYGAGSRDLEQLPNLLRVILGTPRAAATETIVQVEAGIDDMNPELFGYLMERLFEDGALDVAWIPAQMKKNRPGVIVSVLCAVGRESRVIDRIIAETTTTGVRFQNVQRQIVPRESVSIETRFGTVAVKRIGNPDGSRRIVPEYEVCRRIAIREGLPLRDVYDAIVADGNRAESPGTPRAREH
ncbi:MAG TPA: nickel pincer cofactor biosynthesis protein LarC [Desulfobacterales bacterium]